MVQFKAKCHEDNVVGPSTYVRDVADLKGNQSNIRGKDKLREVRAAKCRDRVPKLLEAKYTN